MKEPVLGIILSGERYNVVVSPSMAKSVYAFQGALPSPAVNQIMEKAFGDSGVIRGVDTAELKALRQNVSSLFQCEPFVTEVTEASIRRVEREIPYLVTFSRSVVDQVPWERASEMAVPDTDPSVCEANLFSLVRNFVAHLTTVGYMGEAIFEAFPNVLYDLWILGAHFPVMSRGGPRWLSPGLSTAHRARDRLLSSLAGFHAAFVAWDDGRDPGVKFRDLDDVSEPVKQRIRGLHKMGVSAATSAHIHLSFLWAMNGNITNIIFWNLLRVYAEPSLLEEVRKEITPHVKSVRPSREETGFPIEEQAQLYVDSHGLFNSCPLLKASLYETLRVDTAGVSLKELNSDLTLAESKDDAASDGIQQPRVYKISKGDNITIPLGVLHNDSQHYSNPTQYDPLRFITTDPNTDVKRTEMHTLKPFSGGVAGIRGCEIAERECLLYVSAILSMWDVKPIGRTQLEVPGHASLTGSYLPNNDPRVRIRCRV